MSRPTRFLLLFPAALPLLLLSLPAYADCVPPGTPGDESIVCTGVDTNGAAALGGSDTVTVTPGAEVSNAGAAAINLGAGSGEAAVNNGRVEAAGSGAGGIFDPSGGTTAITNNSVIVTQGFNANGVGHDGDAAAIVNAPGARIQTLGVNSDAIEVNGDTASVTNGGLITTGGTDADGIDVDADAGGPGGSLIVNDGTITTTADDADGIENRGADTTIINNGDIVTSGDNNSIDPVDGSFRGAAGIGSDGDGSSITNAGSIVTTGAFADGIVVRGIGSSVLNAAGASITVDTGQGSQCINTRLGPGTVVTQNGTLNCAGGTAISGGAGADSVNLGPASVTNGDIVVGAGGDGVTASGSALVNGDIDGGAGVGSLVLDGGAGEAGLINGDIIGFESLDKNGAGAWTLNGDAAVGSANINAGRLTLAGGLLTGDTVIDDGATLAARNAAITGNVTNNGTLDTAATTLAVDGDYLQGATGELVMTTGTAAAGGVRATGAASLAGGVTVDFLDPQNVGFGDSSYPLAVADGGRTGQFDRQTIDPDIQGEAFGSLYRTDILYTDQAALLQVNRASLFGRIPGLNRVQEAAAGAFDDATASGDLSDELAAIVMDINNLPAEQQLVALQTTSIGTHDELARVSRFLTRQAQASLYQRLRRLCQAGEAGRPRRGCAREGLWIEASGQSLEQDPGPDGFIGFDADSYGAALGNDWRVGTNGYLGFAAGLAEADVEFNRAGGMGDVDSYYVAGYGGVRAPRWYAAGNVIYARHDYQQDRNIFVGVASSVASSEHDGEEYAFSGEAGFYLLGTPTWRLTPFVGLQYSVLDEEGFSESGAGALNQRVQARETDSLRSDLGLRLLSHVPVGPQQVFSSWASLAWSHNFEIDDRRVAATFAGAPGTVFDLDGREIDANGIKAELGLGYGDPGAYRLSLVARGEFRGELEALGAMVQFTKLYE